MGVNQGPVRMVRKSAIIWLKLYGETGSCRLSRIFMRPGMN
jgi:hypothetical protein